jgi:MinD-like ATPase involved in chromosome partitioning or flagellar assembly
MADGIVALALIGGDERLERELVELSSSLGDVAILPEAAADRADALLIADGQRGAALDRVRVELGARPGRRVLLVGAPGSIDPAEAMACGARGVLEYPLSAGRLRAAIAAAGCHDEVHAPFVDGGRGPIVLLGAAGGCGLTTCAVAIAAALPHGALIDLDLSSGDAAVVAGAHVDACDALLALAHAPGIDTRDLRAQLAEGPSTRVLPAPSLPEQADLVDEGGVSQVLDAVRRAGIVSIVDAGSRIGVETLPALERASAIVIVSPPGPNGRRGVARLAGLLIRLGLADRPVGIVASRVWPHRRSEVRGLSVSSGLPLWATVPESPSVGRAARSGAPPPTRPFARLAQALAEIGDA